MNFRRLFHIGKLYKATQMSSLAKLRKSTGYTMTNCKKALELHPEDLQQAEEWLHQEAKKQGWAKISNVQQKSVGQGMLGVYCKGSVGAMVEVNCETDFVAKNIEFQAFVGKVLSSCINHDVFQAAEGDCKILHLDKDHLLTLKVDTSTLGDLAASLIGKLREQTMIRRAVCMKTTNDVFLSSFTHPPTICPNFPEALLGKYGSLIALRPRNKDTTLSRNELEELGQQLCQHIVGMNPLSIGKLEEIIHSDEAVEKEVKPMKEEITQMHTEDNVTVKENEQHEDTDSDSDEEGQAEEKVIDTNETRLLNQQFLPDPSMKVFQFLSKHKIDVVDFRRFECGEI